MSDRFRWVDDKVKKKYEPTLLNASTDQFEEVTLLPKDVLLNHLRAVATGEAEKVIKDFSENSVLYLPECILGGRDDLIGIF